MSTATATAATNEISHYQFTDEQRRVYKEDGYLVVDNFLPVDVAERLNAIYEAEQAWEKIDQVRETHYQHVFKTDNPYLPGEDESYIARFDRSKRLEGEEEFGKIFQKYFRPSMIDISEFPLTNHDIRCYRLDHGDLYRSHVDDYAGEIGCIYYINKRWVWDWGGILHVSCEQPDEISSMFPKFNRVVFLNHGGFKFPHFISEVASYAKTPRYTIVSFNS